MQVVTEECLLDPSRNPHLGREGIEQVCVRIQRALMWAGCPESFPAQAFAQADGLPLALEFPLLSCMAAADPRWVGICL
jgi:hypothetical protein